MTMLLCFSSLWSHDQRGIFAAKSVVDHVTRVSRHEPVRAVDQKTILMRAWLDCECSRPHVTCTLQRDRSPVAKRAAHCYRARVRHLHVENDDSPSCNRVADACQRNGRLRLAMQNPPARRKREPQTARRSENGFRNGA